MSSMFQTILRQHCCSNVLTIFGEVQAICRSWWIRWSVEGVRRVVRREPRRSVLCAQSEELHQKRACLESDARYGVGKFERGGGGGVRIFGRGVREKGGSGGWFGRTPRTPPGYGPVVAAGEMCCFQLYQLAGCRRVRKPVSGVWGPSQADFN